MAGQFCMACGKPLPMDAKFCSGCAAPVGSGASSGAPAPSATPSPAAPSGGNGPTSGPVSAPPLEFGAPGAVPPLATTLGLDGCRSFMVEHQLLSGGRNYRVLTHEKRHLFTVKESMGQELMSTVLGGMTRRESGFQMGIVRPAPRTFVWNVADASGVPQGTISIQMAGNTAISTLSDSAGTPVVAVSVERSMVGGLNATAAFPDGRTMFQTHGNLLRHNFSIHDPSGAEVAKVHEGWASVRDTYHLDLTGNIDPLCPLIFAILIDREKAAN